MVIYVVMDEGCQECGERSQLIGAFLMREEAELAAHQYESAEPQGRWGRADWRGQHQVCVYEGQLL